MLKAVPVAFEAAEINLTPQQISLMIFKLLQQSDVAEVYGLWNREEGMLGATPELLFRYEGAQLHSVALAGTRRRTPSASTMASSVG